MAKDTHEYDQGIYPYTMSLAEVLDLPKKEEISKNITEYNTNRPAEAMRILKEAGKKDQEKYITISGWDSDTNLMIPIEINPGGDKGKEYVIRADKFLAEMASHKKSEHARGTTAEYLSKELISHTDLSKGHIDFFQISVFHK